jgi:hypothetical protein
VSLGYSSRRALVASSDENELEWLRERGVRIDEKGRIIASLPIPNDELEPRKDDDEPSIAELMRRDVDRRVGGSRGRRRRRPPKAAPCTAPTRSKLLMPARVGRPLIGDEVRVHVQTTIALQTRELLTKRSLTLADVLDICARELADDL